MPKSILPPDTVFVRWTCTKCDYSYVLPAGVYWARPLCKCGAAMAITDATRAEYETQLVTD